MLSNNYSDTVSLLKKEEENTPAEVEETETKPSKLKRMLLPLIAIVIIAATAAGYYLYSSGFFAVQTAEGGVVARVNGEEIARTDLENFQNQLAAQQGLDFSTLDPDTQSLIQNQALNVLISQELLRQEVERVNILVSQEEVDSQLASIKSQFESDEIYQQELATQNMTEGDLRDQIVFDLRVQSYLSEQIDPQLLLVSEDEIEEFYRQSIGDGDDAPAIAEVRPQIEQLITQQKQQEQISFLIQQLQSVADIEILI